MRLLALLAAGLFASAVIAADDKKDEKKTKDEEAILGTWRVEKFESGTGKDPSAEDLAKGAGKARLTFQKGGALVVVIPGEAEKKGEYKLDPAAIPKAIDSSPPVDADTSPTRRRASPMIGPLAPDSSVRSRSKIAAVEGVGASSVGSSVAAIA
jgi:uncharacterized protein (TIGR03067 family)